jgi:hypothetical protein
MFPPVLKVKGDGRVIGESREGSFGGVINALILCASSSKLPEFVSSE